MPDYQPKEERLGLETKLTISSQSHFMVPRQMMTIESWPNDRELASVPIVLVTRSMLRTGWGFSEAEVFEPPHLQPGGIQAACVKSEALEAVAGSAVGHMNDIACPKPTLRYVCCRSRPQVCRCFQGLGACTAKQSKRLQTCRTGSNLPAQQARVWPYVAETHCARKAYPAQRMKGVPPPPAPT